MRERESDREREKERERERERERKKEKNKNTERTRTTTVGNQVVKEAGIPKTLNPKTPKPLTSQGPQCRVSRLQTIPSASTLNLQEETLRAPYALHNTYCLHPCPSELLNPHTQRPLTPNPLPLNCKSKTAAHHDVNPKHPVSLGREAQLRSVESTLAWKADQTAWSPVEGLYSSPPNIMVYYDIWGNGY